MESRELRIGNLIYNEDGFIHQVDGVNVLGVTSRPPNTKVPFENASALKYSPIPLTEEWLIKFGATRTNGHYLSYMLGELQLCRDGDNLYFYGNSGLIGMPLKYVHSLQNLYFALTGEELQIGGK